MRFHWPTVRSLGYRRSKTVDPTFLHLPTSVRKYPLDTGSTGILSLRELCNQIIHRFVFLPLFSDAGMLGGSFAASCRAEDQYLFSVALADIVSLSSQVAEDNIVTLEARRSAFGAPM
ncbi:MAG: hypothetical protein AAFV01_12100 [Bacteroidota bacterium]